MGYISPCATPFLKVELGIDLIVGWEMVDLENISNQHADFIKEQMQDFANLNDYPILYKHPDLSKNDKTEYPIIVIELYPESVFAETLGRKIEDDTYENGVEDEYRLRFTIYCKKGLSSTVLYPSTPPLKDPEKVSGTQLLGRIKSDLFNIYRKNEAELKLKIPDSTMLEDLYPTDSEVILKEHELVYQEMEGRQKIMDKWN